MCIEAWGGETEKGRERARDTGMKERSRGRVKSLELSLGGVGRDRDPGSHFVVLFLSSAETQETGMKPA